jgi:hypothetical protein
LNCPRISRHFRRFLETKSTLTSLERTLAECLVERKRIGTNVAVEALRKAITQKKTTPSKVLEAAIQLGFAERIRPYIEAMAYP